MSQNLLLHPIYFLLNQNKILKATQIPKHWIMDSQPTAKTQQTDSKTKAEANYSPLINILEKYKTKKCEDPKCKYSKGKSGDSESLLLFDCFDYHTEADRRRLPFIASNTQQGTSKSLLYSQNVALEILLGQKPNETSRKHCINGYEYLYHPLNYKTQPCQLAKSSKCTTEYCPYYHSTEEREYFNKARKAYDDKNNEFPVIEGLQANLNKLSEIKRVIPPEEKSPKANALPEPAVPKDASDPYILNEPVKFIEDHFHEFKCLKLHLDTVIKYICGFLNSKGGTLYFGINNEGFVKGTEVKDFEISNFTKKLYDALKQFAPPVNEDLVKVKFAPIYKRDKAQDLVTVPQSYVVEFEMKRPDRGELFFTNYKECFVKRSASINQLKTKEIKDYIKTAINKKNSDLIEKLEKKLDILEGRNIDTLQITEISGLEEQLKATLRKADELLNMKPTNNQTQQFQPEDS